MTLNIFLYFNHAKWFSYLIYHSFSTDTSDIFFQLERGQSTKTTYYLCIVLCLSKMFSMYLWNCLLQERR